MLQLLLLLDSWNERKMIQKAWFCTFTLPYFKLVNSSSWMWVRCIRCTAPNALHGADNSFSQIFIDGFDTLDLRSFSFSTNLDMFLYFSIVSHLGDKTIINAVDSMKSVAQWNLSALIGDSLNYQTIRSRKTMFLFWFLSIVTFQSIILISLE